MSRIARRRVVPRHLAPPGLLALALLAGAACSPRPAADAGGPGAGAGGRGESAAASGGPSSESDSARIARLERAARALARVEGCAASEQCRAAPLGHRACGGPRTYLAYCAATTDSAALFRALDALADAEEAYQRKVGMASTCEFRAPPVVTASAGRCVGAGGP